MHRVTQEQRKGGRLQELGKGNQTYIGKRGIEEIPPRWIFSGHGVVGDDGSRALKNKVGVDGRNYIHAAG